MAEKLESGQEDNNLFRGFLKKNGPNSSLGSMEEWSPVLKKTWDICLNSQTPMGIFWGEDFAFFCNEAWREQFGYSMDQFGKPINKLAENLRNLEEDLRLVQTTGKTKTIKQQPLGCTENIAQIAQHHVLLNPVFDENHEVAGVLTIAANSAQEGSGANNLYSGKPTINEWKHRIYEIVISNTPDLIYVFDLDFRFIFANQALLDMWGKTTEESLGKTLAEIGYEPWHVEMHERELKKVIRTKKPIRGEVPFKHAVLGRRIYDYIFIPVLNDDNEVEAIAGTTRDITKSKLNEEKRIHTEEKLHNINETLEERVEERTAALTSYQKQLRSLAAQLSRAEERERQRLAADLHDNLGQLLAMCKMEIDLLFKKVDDPGLTQLSELINTSISYTRELTSDLKPPPSLNKEDISVAIDWVVKRMKKHGLEIIFNDDQKPKPLTSEVRTALFQSVRELLMNVLKHSGVRKAEVELSLKDKKVEIRVKDYGNGFDTEKKNGKPSDEGGFGLFSIQERMMLIGGELIIKSKPQQGAEMILVAPLTDEVKSGLYDFLPEEPVLPVVQEKSTEKIKVLLVDDHRMILKGLRKIIEQEDDLMVIAEAVNGREAVKLARSEVPDVIVMDIDMPVMNGIQATRKITSEFDSVRVIGLSLHHEKSVAEAMRKAGATAYITKTEAFEALCATIRSEANTGKSL